MGLRKAKQECINLEGSKLGLQTRLAEQESNISNLKQTLLRTTLAKQSLESEKKELMRKSEHSDIGSPATVTKVVYFTPRSVTPFMSTIPKAVGKISLRDFKTLFDRPGFYRYHFKTMDKEFGMVKEEISDDDKVLPGVEGKIVVWVEEE